MTATLENTERTTPRSEYDAEASSARAQTVATLGTATVEKVIQKPQFDPYTAASTHTYGGVIREIVD